MASARDVARRFAWAALAAAAAACDPRILVGSDDVDGASDTGASNDVTISSDAVTANDAGGSDDADGSSDADATIDAGEAGDTGEADTSSDAADSGDALPGDAGDGGDAGGPDDAGTLCSLDAGADAALTPLAVPFTTGFENVPNGFSDFGGNCYQVGAGSSFTIVSAPVHSGLHAAAFTVDSAQYLYGAEARCVRSGAYPASAYYGAYYYLPQIEVNTGNWNLLHFRTPSAPNAPSHGMWDVSLINAGDAGLAVSVYDFLRMRPIANGYPGPGQDAGSAVPINQWFHLEVFLRRACDNTGEFTLYVNGNVVFSLKGLSTVDSPLGEWHIGNLATSISPPISTVYVDDVTILATGP